VASLVGGLILFRLARTASDECPQTQPNPIPEGNSNFSTSLHFHVRPRQRIAVLGWRLPEMCRSVYEHSVPADVGPDAEECFHRFLRNSCVFQEVEKRGSRGPASQSLEILQGVSRRKYPVWHRTTIPSGKMPSVSRLVPQKGSSGIGRSSRPHPVHSTGAVGFKWNDTLNFIPDS